MKTIKIDIISGFLGAGKTTFIQKLINDLYPWEKVVILENEFGKINIDEETLKRDGLQVKPIQAGCICCSKSNDLAKGIQEILSEYHPNRIIIEPTGIAKLSEVKKLLTEDIDKAYEIDHIITIVDAKNYYTRTMISKDFFEDQIRASEIIFLSKTNSMNIEQLLQVKQEIFKIHPFCLVVDEVWNNILPDRLKNLIDFKPNISDVKHGLGMRVNHRNDFDRHEIIIEKALSMGQVSSFLKDVANGVYGEIHRVKGIYHDTDALMHSIDYIPDEIIIKPVTGGQTNSNFLMLCLIGRHLDKYKLDLVF